MRDYWRCWFSPWWLSREWTILQEKMFIEVIQQELRRKILLGSVHEGDWTTDDLTLILSELHLRGGFKGGCSWLRLKLWLSMHFSLSNLQQTLLPGLLPWTPSSQPATTIVSSPTTPDGPFHVIHNVWPFLVHLKTLVSPFALEDQHFCLIDLVNQASWYIHLWLNNNF